MFVTIQGKPIPVEWQLEAIAHICKVFGIETKQGCAIIQGKRVPIKMVNGAIAHICKEFQIDIKPGTIPEMKKEFKQRVVGSTTMLDLYTPPDLKGTAVRSLYVGNLPPSFNQFHIIILIHLLSDFEIRNMNFYIDMYQHAQNRYTGDCLIRFINAKFLAQVFIDMQALRYLNKKIDVRLDNDCSITAAKDRLNPLYNPSKKCNKMLKYYILHQEFDYSNCTMLLTGDTAKETSNNNNNTVELKHDDDLIEIIEKRDTIEIHDSDDDIDEVKDQDDDVVEIMDSADETRCVEKDELVSIDETSMQIPKSVPETEQLDDNTQRTCSRNKEVTDNSDLMHYEDRTSEIEKSNAGNAGESSVMFYEDKTGETHTNSSKRAFNKSQAQYKVTTDSIDDRTIVSITTSGNPKDKTKIRCIVTLIRKVDKISQFYVHTIKNENKSTGVFLVKFPTAKSAIKICNSLKGAKIRKRNIQVKLLSNKNVSLPINDENTTVCNPTSKEQLAERKLISANNAKRKLLAKGKQVDVLPTRNNDNFNLTKMPPEERSYDTYGLNEEFLEKHSINVPLRATVIVKNLTFSVDENKLHEVFSMAGVIRRINKFFSDTDGLCAKIEFDHPLEAVQAISLLHNQELYNQKITVAMDTDWEERPLPFGLCSVGRGLGENGEPLRNVRNNIHLFEAKEALVETGQFTKISATKRTMPFQYSYIQRNREIEDKASDSSNNIDSNASKEQNTNDDIFDGTSFEELNNALISQGLIPEDANCKDLDDLLDVLKNKPQEKQTEPMHVDSEDQNRNISEINMETAPPNQGENNRHMNFVRNMPYSLNRPLNPNMANIPNLVNPHCQVSNHRMPNFSQPNMASNFRLRPNMKGSDHNIFNPNMPNMAYNGPHTNQNPMFRPCVENALQRASMLYEDRPPSTRNRDQKTSQNSHPLPNVNRQVQNTQPQLPSKLNNQRYFGRNVPQDCDPFRPNKDIREPPNRQVQETGNKGDSSKDRVPGDKSGGGKKETDTLIFKNLPIRVPTEALVSKLSEVGELLFCNLTGMGRAVVRFKNTADAERCTKLFHGSKVEGQVISVTPVYNF